MPMVWRIRTCSLETAEMGTGTWEPFAVVEEEDGTPLVVCKGLFDTADEDAKSTEQSGSLGGDW